MNLAFILSIGVLNLTGQLMGPHISACSSYKESLRISLKDQWSQCDASSLPEVPWNITQIGADSVWNLGYLGQGVIIGILDTGVDTSHPALSGKFSGYWLDLVQGLPDPYDDHGHGTFLTGIILGGDGPGPFSPDIGVAPEAQYAVAKVLDYAGAGDLATVLQGLEWFISLVADSGVSLGSVVIPFGIPGPSLLFWPQIETLADLGVLTIATAGALGPGYGSIVDPASYPIALALGASDQDDHVTYFSGRGPAPDIPPWNDPSYWCRPDWNFFKPELVAPGTDILSATGGGGYSLSSGTSWATAHAAGAVALLLSAGMGPDRCFLYNLLLDSAFRPPEGEPYPNNDYGWGRLDVYNVFGPTRIAENSNLRYNGSLTPVLAWPNPTRGKIQLVIPENERLICLMIADVSGRIVRIEPSLVTGERGSIILNLPQGTGISWIMGETDRRNFSLPVLKIQSTSRD